MKQDEKKVVEFKEMIEYVGGFTVKFINHYARFEITEHKSGNENVVNVHFHDIMSGVITIEWVLNSFLSLEKLNSCKSDEYLSKLRKINYQLWELKNDVHDVKKHYSLFTKWRFGDDEFQKVYSRLDKIMEKSLDLTEMVKEDVKG